MSNLSIRNLDPELDRWLRRRAATAGHSTEDEVLGILQAEWLRDEDNELNLFQRIRHRIDPVGGIDLPLPEREPAREPPDLSR